VKEPALSVVVALISGRRADLERCLDSLCAQARRNAETFPTEILVPYDDPVAEVTELAGRFPEARFLRAEGLDTRAARAGASREHHDTLRTIGLRAARGRVVALTEDHAVASDTWCADMLRLLDEHPEVAALGGAVECRSARLLNQAVYYCDFGRYQNPLPAGPAAYVSDSNVAYRRAALEAVRDAWADDYHETIVHWALVAQGHELWLHPGSVVWQQRGDLTPGLALRERFVWGRSFAGTRVAAAPFARRMAYAAASLLLPALLTLRLARGVVARRRTLGRFAACLPWIVALETVWAAGELCGYLTRDPGCARTGTRNGGQGRAEGAA
jgi:Glycosyl transferase family 2